MSYVSFFPLAHAPGNMDPMTGFMRDALHGSFAFRDHPTFPDVMQRRYAHPRMRTAKGRFGPSHRHAYEIMEIVDHDFVLQ